MFGLLDWFRRRKAARATFPDGWRAYLRADVPFYASMDKDPAGRTRFEDKLKIFVLTKHFEGAGGFTVDERARVVIAAAAARLTMNLPGQHYQRLSDIVIYPGDYRHPDSARGEVGAVAILGEAHQHGTVVLSWDAVLAGLRNTQDGHDTATHEFAHVLDAQDGRFDGTPVLERFSAYAPWARVMSAHFLARRGKGKRLRGRQVLRAYATTNEAEFFAVATEAFFEKPRQLRQRHPELYEVLAAYYHATPDAPGAA
jgi:Mlc titration factor MtfA (ptsG expression regulator)